MALAEGAVVDFEGQTGAFALETRPAAPLLTGGIIVWLQTIRLAF